MNGLRLVGIFLLVLFLIASVFLLFFACGHYNNWWSLLVAVPCVVAFVTPAICFGYNTEQELTFSRDLQMDPARLHTCRELGWITGALLYLCAYGVPVLVWWNSGTLGWDGVTLVMMALTCIGLAYMLWARIFLVEGAASRI